jgi:fused
MCHTHATRTPLSPQNIIRMFDYFETDREFCVVTEFAQGELFEILEDDGSLPELEVRGVAAAVVVARYGME